jgi:hypothetical protein
MKKNCNNWRLSVSLTVVDAPLKRNTGAQHPYPSSTTSNAFRTLSLFRMDCCPIATSTSFSPPRLLLSQHCSLQNSVMQVSTRWMATQKKKDKKKQKQAANDAIPKSPADAPAEQHSEWVAFQKSIAVEGFETGQTVQVETGRRGGRAATRARLTKREEMHRQLQERQRLAGSGGGGHFPPMRYSDEETERLLKMAYAAIPPRAGRRGTRSLKRQKYRWHLVRRIRRVYKAHIVRFHARRMEKRSLKIKQVKAMIQGAPEVVARDEAYRQQVLEQHQKRLGLLAQS